MRHQKLLRIFQLKQNFTHKLKLVCLQLLHKKYKPIKDLNLNSFCSFRENCKYRTACAKG